MLGEQLEQGGEVFFAGATGKNGIEKVFLPELGKGGLHSPFYFLLVFGPTLHQTGARYLEIQINKDRKHAFVEQGIF